MTVSLDRVQIQSVEVTRAPGLPRGLKIDRFGPGINVVTGPNASGKSTTARLLHQLFANTPGRDEIEAIVRFSYAGADWTLQRYGPHVTTYRNGQQTDPPRFDVMSDDTRSRYLLSLHDLLRADDMAFARVVLREAAGGFDLERAINQIKLPLPKTESDVTRAWDEARRNRETARQKYESLAREEQGLQKLREDEQTAIAAHSRLEVLREIEAALQATEALHDATTRVAELPPVLARYRGDELARLTVVAENERELGVRLDALTEQIAQEDAARQATGIDAGPVTREAIDRLQGVMATLQHERTESDRAVVAAQTAAAREVALREGLAGALQRADPDGSARRLLNRLSELADQRALAASRLAGMDDLGSWVGEIPEPGDLGALQETTRLLRAWLQQPAETSGDPRTSRLRWLVLIAAAVCAVEAIVLGIAVHPALAGLGLIGVALAIAGVVLRPDQADERSRIANDLVHRGLLVPDVWDERSVAALLNDVQVAEQRELYQREIATRWRELPGRINHARRDLQRFDDDLDDAYAELGLADEHTPPVLDQIAESIRVWRIAVDDLTVAEARAQALQRQHTATLASFNQLAAGFGFGEVDDAQHAQARLHDLQQRAQEANRADQAVERAYRELEQVVQPGLTAIETTRQTMLRELAADDVAAVRELAPLHERWVALAKARADAETTLRDRTRNLDAIDLAEWSIERVHQERAEFERIAANQQAISQRIGGIVNAVDAARTGATIDTALRAEERAAAAVRERFAARARQIVADRIAEQVRRDSEGSSLSPVARIARQRFAEFTQGRYQLRFGIEDGKPQFRAEDRQTGGQALSLDALSSATRVQLLIAVRAAFVESNEREAVLPLFLDETLANSDEARANAMVAATKALSAGGRQIFYFTAQQDEVERWQEANPDHVEVDLVVADLASNETRRPVMLPVTMEMVAVAPEPNGHSRDEYRQLLGVGPLDRWAPGDGDIHLWYLVPDPVRLWSLLRRRIETWGQLRTFAESQTLGMFGLSEADYAVIRARAMACQKVRELHQVGHGRPVTALDLDQSAAFTERYREEAVRLLDECAGDGGVFLQRLKLGALKRLNTSSIEKVEDHFREHKHLAYEAQLSTTDLEHQVLRHCAPAIDAGQLELDDLTRLFNDLAAEAPRSLQAIGE